MSLRWRHLGLLSVFVIWGNQANAQAPRAERDGGLLPPVVQVVAKEPIDEEEITVELIKVMPKTREEKVKNDLGENFKVIKIKREKTDEPISISSEEVAKPAPAKAVEKSAEKPTEKIVKVRRDEPLNFLPAEKQKALPTSTTGSTPTATLTAPGVIVEERAPRVIKVPVREPVMSDWTLPELSWPASLTPSCRLASDACDSAMPTLADSNVGWIDSALIGTQARLRYDARWRNPHPDRAEFFVGRSKQYFDGFDISGRGFEVPESNIDMFEGTGYFEWAFTQRFSSFVELPLRYIRPTENPTAIGLSDLSFGFKLAYFMMPEQVQTFQLRFTFPTASDGKGLGTGHSVIEPSLLLWQKLSEKWTLESELRNWIPVGGTNHAGFTLRYAFGFSYDMYQSETVSVKPVTELIFWSTLRGYESEFIDSLPTFQSTEDARGTVIESAWGLRGTVWGNCDWYAGYSFAVTDTTWFRHNIRAELRWRF